MGKSRRSPGGRKLRNRRKRREPLPAAVRARTVRRKIAEGKRRTRGRADQLRGAKETEGVGAERIEGEEVEVEGEAGAGAGVEDEAGREEGREGGTTAEKIRGGVGVGAEMSGGGEVKIG